MQMHLPQLLYERLGNLFYAIAAADRGVRQKEETRLLEKIQSIWAPAESSSDAFGTDLAHYIFISFDFLHAQQADPETAFRQFEDFYRTHASAFSPQVKKNILRTAEAIAEAFSGINKCERAYLSRLEKLLNQ
ncbi:MAG: hypothetical protein KatS3mg031_1962 [Chitinophagales bacterium]|nr:MAG: hypothetical protein KatS3mg031_1962 [Chitinophagales bacterium]